MERHGYKGTPTYNSWINMRVRCSPTNNSNKQDKANYYDRGIRVCSDWDKSFLAFLQDMGERPKGMTIDRVEHNGNYCKSNCKWSMSKEQVRNTRVNRIIEYKGEKRCLVEWAEAYDLNSGTLAKRLRDGWSMDKALNTELHAASKGVAHNSKLIKYQGESRNMKDWARHFGIKYATLHKRITKYGKTFEEAVSTPVSCSSKERNKR